MKDQFGRDIIYLRISVTNECNLRCQYCMPKGQIYQQYKEDLLTLGEMFTSVKAFAHLGTKKIRITGGEPLLRAGILSLIEKIAGLKEIEDIAMTTNGVLLKRYAKDLKHAGLQRVNISLDSLDERQYEEITGGGNLQNILDGIEEAKKVGLNPIKINTVLIKQFNDHMIERFVNWTKEQDIEVRFIELMPIGNGIDWSKERFLPADTVLQVMPQLQPVAIEDKSSTAAYYRLPGGKGKVGLIRPVSCKFCDYCNRVRVTAEGKLKLCLLSNQQIDLRTALRSSKDIEEMLQQAIKQKPKVHRLENNEYMETGMFRIGG